MIDGFKYEVGDTVLFNQGNQPWDYKGEGKIITQQKYTSCNAYLIEMLGGNKIQVKEDQVRGIK